MINKLVYIEIFNLLSPQRNWRNNKENVFQLEWNEMESVERKSCKVFVSLTFVYRLL